VYFEIQDFQNCFLTHGKKVAQHFIIAVGKRLQEVMREEDIAARLGVAKYALVLPMTNKQKTQIVIERVRESIDKLVFDTGKEKIRVAFKTGYSSPDFSQEIEFNELLDQADDALQRAVSSSTEGVVCYDDALEAEAPPVIITEQDVEQAFAHILAGNYYQIPENQLTTIIERLSPFMQYVDNQLETVTSESPVEKNIAV
jgi:diguanylate cyclase (GGDEF)-like protein